MLKSELDKYAPANEHIPLNLSLANEISTNTVYASAVNAGEWSSNGGTRIGLRRMGRSLMKATGRLCQVD